MSGRGFRASSWGAAAIIVALLLLVFHRFGSFLLFFLIGAGLLWYGRTRREAAQEEAAREEAGTPEEGARGEDGPEREGDALGAASHVTEEPPPAGEEREGEQR